MKEQEVDEMFLACDFQPVLAPYKSKESAHLAQEMFNSTDKRPFQFAFAEIFVKL
jgi:hypothetical protein